MEKSPDAYRTIAEVAIELDVPRHVLRFWETRFSELKPLKRGGGRRYYRPEDVSLLRLIYSLLYREGYTIKGAKRLLDSKKTEQLRSNNAENAHEREELREPESSREQDAKIQEIHDVQRRNTSRKTAGNDELQTLLQELKACRELISRSLHL